MRAALVVFVAVASLPLMAGCRDNSWSTAQGKLAAAMAPVSNAIDQNDLPACPATAFADGKPIVLTDLQVLRLASASDAYLATNRREIAPVCTTFLASRAITESMNPFNSESSRVSNAKKILASTQFAVVTTESHRAPGASGGGKAAGRIVLVAQGKALCATPWSAENGETTSVQVDKITRFASDNARTAAWTGDLSSRSCRAIEALLPRPRNER
jgi:hypothetical protein